VADVIFAAARARCVLLRKQRQSDVSDGWNFASSPVIIANWLAASWTVPVGGGFGRLFKVGEQQFDMQLQAICNVATS